MAVKGSNAAISFHQPSIYSFVMGSGSEASQQNSSDGCTTRSKTQNTSNNPPERPSKKKSNKMRKAVEKNKRQRKNQQEKSRQISGDSIHSISSNESSENTSSDTSSPTASRSVSQMLASAYPSPPSSPSWSNQTQNNSSEELARFKIYSEYLENENKSIKLQRDLIHTDLETAQKTIASLRKTNKKITTQNDNLNRAASKHSGMRRHTDLQHISTQTVPTPVTDPDSPAALQEATNIAIAKYNSICDQMSHAAKQLLDTVSNSKITVPTSPQPLNTNANPCAQDQFETVTSRDKRRRPVPPPATSNIQQIPVLSASVPGNQHVQVHSVMPSYSDVTRQGRPGQGARQRKKLIILGSSLTDGLSAELKSHNIDSTTHIYRGGKLDLIRERVPHIFSKDINKQPDKVFVLAGGNDAEDSTTDLTINGYEGLIREIRTACPRTKIIISSIPPRKNNIAINRRITEVNSYLKDRGLRNDNVQFVDVVPVDSNMFTQKLVHLTRSGKVEFAKRLQPFLAN